MSTSHSRGKPPPGSSPADHNATLSSERAAGAPRIVLFGIRCGFTAEVLAGLHGRGIEIAALFLPGPPRLQTPLRRRPLALQLPVADDGSDPEALALRSGVPVLLTGNLRSGGHAEALRDLRADAIVVACYPKRIPAELLETAPLGGINIHPSMLPDLRGPDPLFWILRRGDASAGVTVHRLVQAFDAGPILAQRELQYADGLTEDELSGLCARAGAEIAAGALSELHAGTATEFAQDETRETYAPWPSEADYVLDPSWSARRVFNFVRGVVQRGVPMAITLDGVQHQVLDALAWQERDTQPTEGQSPGVDWIRCYDGWVLLRLSAVVFSRATANERAVPDGGR